MGLKLRPVETVLERVYTHVRMYLRSHYVSVRAVCDGWRLLSQLFCVHRLERSNGEGVQKLSEENTHPHMLHCDSHKASYYNILDSFCPGYQR